jgi:competence protein ComEC
VSADLRTTWLGASAWAGALVGLALGAPAVGLTLVVVTGAVLAAAAGRLPSGLVPAVLVVTAVVAGAAGVRVEATTASPVAGWAADRVVVDVVMTVRSDPVTRRGRFGDYVVVRGQLREATARGRRAATSVPVLVIGDPAWQEVPLGAVVRTTGRLAPATSAREAAVLTGPRAPELVAEPAGVLRAADAVRESVRRAAAGGPDDASALVPALVTGDDQRLPDDVVEEFRTAGLTHLTAVSGTNLTLVLVSLLLVSRWCGVRGRGVVVVGLVGVVGFVLLARPEPSVVRAAAMGTVALLGLGSGGRAAGVRALGAAVFLLLVADPWLARSPGFALSALATAGILFVAPPFRDALAGWLPRPLAEAVAVPLAAQLACTPVVAALSGEVSIVAVAANLLVAPAVGPATVLGLAGGLVGLVVPPVGGWVGWVGAWSAQWIVVVAHTAAALPGAAVGWSDGGRGVAVLTLLCLLLVGVGPRLLRSRRAALVTAVVVGVTVAVPLPTPGWPPRGWLLVMCDVGQGDAIVLASGPGEAVLVDTGPDPPAVDRCLRRLRVTRLSAVLLTHFHADHVDGLPGALAGRAVGELQVTGLAEPADGAARVHRWAAAAGVPVRVPAYGETGRTGDLAWQVLGPRRLVDGHPNDASVVLVVETAGLRLLLTGDVEPSGQAVLAREAVGPVDVLKVPHHGSRHQDVGWLASLRPRVALVSVGEDNDYGHPAPAVLDTLSDGGALVRRTDRHGDVALLLRDGELRVVSAG